MRDRPNDAALIAFTPLCSFWECSEARSANGTLMECASSFRKTPSARCRPMRFAEQGNAAHIRMPERRVNTLFEERGNTTYIRMTARCGVVSRTPVLVSKWQGKCHQCKSDGGQLTVTRLSNSPRRLLESRGEKFCFRPAGTPIICCRFEAIKYTARN